MRAAGNVVEREGREHEIEAPVGDLCVVAVRDAEVLTVPIGGVCQLDHVGRDVDADRVEAELLEKACRTTGATAEIECGAPVHVLGNDCGQVSKGEVVGAGKLERSVRGGPGGIV